jgi:predicted kinase
MPIIYIAMGPKGCGKTNWCLQHLPADINHIIFDEIMFNKHLVHKNDLWLAVYDELRESINNKRNIYINHTNFKQSERVKLLLLIKSFESKSNAYIIKYVCFRPSEEMIERYRNAPIDMIRTEFLVEPIDTFERKFIDEVIEG